MDHLSVAPEKPAQLFRRPSLQPNDQLRTLNYDDLARRRVTVFFRFFMAIPHLLWLGIWSFGMTILAPVLWVATLINRRPPDGLRDVYAMFVRYSVHVYAFWLLAAEPFPKFLGRPGTYPVEVEVPPQGEQGRWSTFFRLLLAFPALMLATALSGFSGGGSNSSSTTGEVDSTTYALSIGGVTFAAAFLGWFYCMARRRMAEGLRDLIVWALGYTAQAYAYLFLLTSKYPNSNPAIAPLAPLPAHPLRLNLTDELRRDRLTVAFRFILAAPHIVWLILWSVPIAVLTPLAWLATLILGRLPSWMHRFIARWVRYGAHVSAFMYVGGGPFPGFVGKPGSYPVDIEIDGPERQPRWAVAFRGLLAFPAFLLGSGLGGVLLVASVGGWFAALFTGRMPEGLRNVIAFGTRYTSQLYGYLLFLTPRYPYSGPADFHR